jgi:Protein of unknown function (DUF3500)
MTRSTLARVGLVAALAVVYVTSVTIASEKTASAMATAAKAWLASLSPEQREQAVLPFDAPDRTAWHYVPNEMFPRKGVTLGTMTDAQKALARDLLKTGMSQRGYMTAGQIMELEKVLQMIEGDKRRFPRDPGAYAFAVFGTPAASSPWGWRFVGHHINFHFTIVDGRLVGNTPTFLGANPAEVREGPQKGQRTLGNEEDAARALLDSLDPSERSVAIVQTTAPNEMLTENRTAVDPLSPIGLKASAMTPPQRELLTKLIEVYTGVMAADIASDRMEKVRKAGLENVAFAWAGETERGKKHYYRIQGPTFLVEYDNAQNDGNHIHSVWRDFNGDFGRDLLREHLRAVPH